MLKVASFRAYDIRGIVGEELSAEVSQRIGAAVGTWLRRRLGKTAPTVVMARVEASADTRLKEHMNILQNVLLSETGLKVDLAGAAALGGKHG